MIKSLWLYVLIVLGAILLLQSLSLSEERIPYPRFRELVEAGELVEVQIKGDALIGRPRADVAGGTPRLYRTGRIEEREGELFALLDQKKVPYTRVPDGRWLGTALLWLVPLALILLFSGALSRRVSSTSMANPALTFGKNKARLYAEKGVPITFRDVAGSHEAKAELVEIIEFLRTPERFRRLGGRIPKGVLLVGPPGTGKTLLARAVAGEASVPFFSISGSEFVEMFVGVGAARVRDLFAQAAERAPCIVFVDELDAVGKARGVGGPIGGNDEREQTLNQLLTEMDGFDARAGMVVMAATNRPEILDPALQRAGRFDRKVVIDRPDLDERREILEVHARGVLLAPDVELAAIAAQTGGLVGADLANLMNEAALLAGRRHASSVSQRDLEDAIERVLGGLERKSRRLSPRERRTVAFHEAGHALMAELLPSVDRVRKISIIPRGVGALGYTLQVPLEDRYLLSRAEILDRVAVLLGGRAAEEQVFGEISTGAQDDLVHATELARRMVREFGMSDTLGVQAYDSRRGFLGDRGPGGFDYSEATARAVDAEVKSILERAYQRARDVLRHNHELLLRVANRLLERETLTGDELRALLGDAAGG